MKILPPLQFPENYVTENDLTFKVCRGEMFGYAGTRKRIKSSAKFASQRSSPITLVPLPCTAFIIQKKDY